ncbi:Septin-1 [Bienertia sinuspersici]
MKEKEEWCDDESMELYWWRRCASPEEMSRLKVSSVADVGCLTPRLKVMREMERLAMVASEGLDDLRHRLVAYRVGDMWVPMGGVKKEEMEFPRLITILMVGHTGGGKSSLINLMYSVLGRAGIIPFAQTSGSSVKSESTTMFLEEHNVLRSMRAGFCVYDSRGFDYDDDRDTLLHLTQWTSEGVRHNQLCSRSNLKDDDALLNVNQTSSKFLKRQVNCAMVVANMAFLYHHLMAADSKPLEPTKHVFCFPALKRGNQNPILVLTHGDKLSAEERIDARIKICQNLGISETSGVYDIVCLTECGVVAEECDPVTAYALTEAVYRALLISDTSHLPKQNFKDRAIFVFSWLLSLIGSFFAFLARLFGNNNQRQNKFKSS